MEEPLAGGTMNQVSKVGNTVHREAGPWTPNIHKLLKHLRSKGIQEVPEPLGFDDLGREILSFIPGIVGHHPLPAFLSNDRILISAAKLLRRIHDATTDVAQIWDENWRVPTRQPVEIICHGDFAPYNCIFDKRNLIGVIDFDYAHPGSRIWDLAYALYRFVPVNAPSNPEHNGDLIEQCRRLRIFCDAYGLEDSSEIIRVIKLRIKYMADFLSQGAARGDKRIQANIEAGHLEIYSADYVYVEKHCETFESYLRQSKAKRKDSNFGS